MLSFERTIKTSKYSYTFTACTFDIKAENAEWRNISPLPFWSMRYDTVPCNINFNLTPSKYNAKHKKITKYSITPTTTSYRYLVTGTTSEWGRNFQVPGGSSIQLQPTISASIMYLQSKHYVISLNFVLKSRKLKLT